MRLLLVFLGGFQGFGFWVSRFSFWLLVLGFAFAFWMGVSTLNHWVNTGEEVVLLDLLKLYI